MLGADGVRRGDALGAGRKAGGVRADEEDVRVVPELADDGALTGAGEEGVGVYVVRPLSSGRAGRVSLISKRANAQLGRVDQRCTFEDQQRSRLC